MVTKDFIMVYANIKAFLFNREQESSVQLQEPFPAGGEAYGLYNK